MISKTFKVIRGKAGNILKFLCIESPTCRNPPGLWPVYNYRSLAPIPQPDPVAIHSERINQTTGAFSVTHGFVDNRISYDQNGNIMTMFRNSTTQGSGGHAAIDNLNYTYDTANPNQLKSVSDASGSAAGFRGGTGNYTYDGNGNLASDPYKGLSALAYNVMNRTDKVSFSSSVNRYIDYTYDAGGNLIRKRQYDNVGGVAMLQNTTDYMDGFVYLNGTLQFFAMPEGRVLNSAGSLRREFAIADQQGNMRISFDNTGTGGTAKVRQENSYQSFGIIMPGSTVGMPTNDNKHLYNGGSEWQNDFANLPDYYQTFNRNYDAAIGRWVGVDPDPKSAESMTVYQYGNDNLTLYNDPLGNKTEYKDYGKANIAGSAEVRMGEWFEDQAVSIGNWTAAQIALWQGDITGVAGATPVAIYVDEDGNVSLIPAGPIGSVVVTRNSVNVQIFNYLGNAFSATNGALNANQAGLDRYL